VSRFLIRFSKLFFNATVILLNINWMISLFSLLTMIWTDFDTFWKMMEYDVGFTDHDEGFFILFDHGNACFSKAIWLLGFSCWLISLIGISIGMKKRETELITFWWLLLMLVMHVLILLRDKSPVVSLFVPETVVILFWKHTTVN